MAKGTAASAAKVAEAILTPDAVDEDVLTTAPEDWQWDTVVEESPTRVIFDTVGDTFIGLREEDERIEPDNKEDEPFEMFVFRGRDGQRYAINKSYKLNEGMAKVAIGQWCRIVYTKDIPTGRKLNPMKDFRVDVRTN